MRTDAASILLGMGYVLDRDFRAYMRRSGEVTIEWLAQMPQPTEKQIDDAATAGAKESLEVVTAKQLKTALYRLGVLDQIESAAQSSKETFIAWTESAEFSRGSALMAELATALPKGVTLAQVFSTARGVA